MTIESQLNENAVEDETLNTETPASETLTIDVSADVTALTDGEELSEEFKTKAATIFEAAVVTRVKAEKAKLEESFEQLVESQVEEKIEGLYEKVDGYLDYCVEQWMNDNEVALERGIKSDITESFIKGLKNLFLESYIEVPEEKFDVVGDLTEQVKSLETQLSEAMEKSISAAKKLEAIKIESLVNEASTDLTDVDAEKFKDLAKELVFEDVETYSAKLKVIRESYFKQTKSDVQSIVSTETTDILSEETSTKRIDPNVAAYASAMGKLFK